MKINISPNINQEPSTSKKIKWMFNLQEQKQEFSTLKNKNKNLQHSRTRIKTNNLQPWIFLNKQKKL
jgi:hypothetical protein